MSCLRDTGKTGKTKDTGKTLLTFYPDLREFTFCSVQNLLKTTKPNMLCMTHQMSHKNRNDLVGSTVRYEMINYKVILVGTGSLWAVLVGTWCYWVSIGQ